MKILTRPKAPKRGTREYTISCSCLTLIQILSEARRYIEPYGYTEEETRTLVTYDNIEVTTEWDYDYEAVVAKFKILVSTKEYEANVVKHEVKLKAYNKWYADNKDEIKAELELREQQKNEDEAARVQKQIDKLGKQLARNQEKLKSMGV